MLKFCGNCGAELSEGTKVCGQCGVQIVSNKNTASSIPGIAYVNPEKKEKTRKTATIIAALAICAVFLVVIINCLSGFVGYKGVVRKLMNAYKNYDIEVFVSMASDWYYSFDDDSYVGENFEAIVSNDLDVFEETVGHKYKFSYEITDSYNLSKHKFEDLLDSLSLYENFDPDIISEVMIVEVTITIDGEDKEMTKEKEIYLTKENGEWRVLYFY